ncbi:MAG: nucleotide pyrophosphohydrolase [Defluviitaleaceae bacterium]|nr:nucleotide pyrophosphohydrolase [Defluviitaleaceae bacterium]
MNLEKLLTIMDTLLGENGCPWDKAQTHESLREYMLEECNEAIDAINRQNMADLQEELGDVLLQVVFHAKLAENVGFFTMDDVIDTLANKLISRHSHVFGSDVALNESDALEIWKKNKEKERIARATEISPKHEN